MRALAAVACLALASLSGCAACCSPYDYTYPVLHNGSRTSCCRDGCSTCFRRSGSREAMVASGDYVADEGYVGDGEVVEEYVEE